VAEKNIILGVTASIAIYKACDIVRKLTGEGFKLSVVMTQESTELIRPIVFQSLSGNKVYQGMFEAPDAWEIEHISLADKADLVLVAPATANIIAKVASGISDDLLTCVIAATKSPVLFAPAMNENMYKNKITQGNIKKLESFGYKFVGPAEGRLACGRSGLGCLASVEEIVRVVKSTVK
jgi:phosphopantothenoylcysteine decarboxylase/phosphopantothenate--cysteine ligase